MQLQKNQNIRDLKRQAKTMAKESKIPLNQAQNKIATELGFKSWSQFQYELDSLPIPQKNRVTFFHISQMTKLPSIRTTERLICISAQMLVSDLVEAMCMNRYNELKEKYNNINQLIIMNIEDLKNKKATTHFLKGVILCRERITLISYLSRDQILNDPDFSDDFKFLIR